MTTPENTFDQEKEDKKRRRKAILAGGLVLGLGAAATLAAWSDDVFANGTFNTGTFELQGATDGSNFQDYDTAPGGNLTFQLTADQMSPDQTVYAPFTIATSTATTLDGDFKLLDVESNDGGLASVLSYSIYSTATHGANCNPDQASALENPVWSDTDVAGAPTTGADTQLEVLKNQGSPQSLCIAVTLGDQTAVEGITPSSTNVVWQFTGESRDA